LLLTFIPAKAEAENTLKTDVMISALRGKILRIDEFLQYLVLNKEKNESRRGLLHEKGKLQLNERALQDFIII